MIHGMLTRTGALLKTTYHIQTAVKTTVQLASGINYMNLICCTIKPQNPSQYIKM